MTPHSGLMRNVAGEFARASHRRKGRMNAFLGDNFLSRRETEAVQAAEGVSALQEREPSYSQKTSP